MPSAAERLLSLDVPPAVLPSFVKTPRDSTIRTGHTARLECAAEGHPAPQIAWQKDGGTDFPAARERRMHVMPDDDVFFIMDVKPEDMGLYSCTARNTAGTVSANATLTVLGKEQSRRWAPAAAAKQPASPAPSGRRRSGAPSRPAHSRAVFLSFCAAVALL